MFKKPFNTIISLVLVLAIAVTTCTSALAASSSKTYVKEMIISYGNTADEAKKWLTDNEYEVLDYNLNDGADDVISTKRAVYIGYKTTNKADEAITDMKLMNMKGGYSVQDYQMLLEEQKSNIRAFISNFIVAVKEYRANYKAGQGRAVNAHDILNILYDDDTKQNMGDLLLNKIREEYTDEEYAALSDEEKAKVADMTTILMQGNSNAVLTIEQTIATATDAGDTLWTERYESAKTYDEMLDEVMKSKKLTVNDAVKQLAAEYDEDAQLIAANFDDYKTCLEKYTNTGISITSTKEEIEAYAQANEDFDTPEWLSLGTQYELLKLLSNDDVTLFDLITSDDYDVENADRYMLYPLVASLTTGQRACLEFLPTYQLIALGINDDASTKEGMSQLNLTSYDAMKNVSVYEDVDRTIFSENVAVTSDAYRLQASSGTNPTERWISRVSNTTLVLCTAVAASAVITGVSWGISSHLNKAYDAVVKKMNVDFSAQVEKKINEIARWETNIGKIKDSIKVRIENGGYATTQSEQNVIAGFEKKVAAMREEKDAFVKSGVSSNVQAINKTWAKVFQYASIAMTCITIVLFSVTLWRAIEDLTDFYNAEFTPIPMHMVDQNVDENDKKTYTYYTAAKCNRVEQNMVTDATKLLGDYGDLNGDVGRQWVALYTTTDKAAGNPVTTDFVVQTANSNLPNDSSTALSMFGESVAQNLTNKKMGYTYADSKDGIYMFYNTDSSAFAASVFSNATYVLVGVAGAAVLAAVFFVGRAVGKKAGKKKEGESENAEEAV